MDKAKMEYRKRLLVIEAYQTKARLIPTFITAHRI